VKACAAESGIDLRLGPVWTTDGILRETRDKVERHHSLGCVGVDMETAALYTVASTMGIDAVAILVASDNVCECRQTDLDRLRGGWRRAAALVVRAARALGG
jgi:purine-nucleoside phosphorylase